MANAESLARSFQLVHVPKKAFLEARSLLSNLACHLKGKIDSGVVSCRDAYVSSLASLAKLDRTDAGVAKIRSRISAS